jgi:hypothetical protein
MRVLDVQWRPSRCVLPHWRIDNLPDVDPMKIAVFDTYVTRPDGRLMHFDILVPDASRAQEQVLAFGRRYLAARGLPAHQLSAEECRFCHMEIAPEPVVEQIAREGFAIIELANCE